MDNRDSNLCQAILAKRLACTVIRGAFLDLGMGARKVIQFSIPRR